MFKNGIKYGDHNIFVYTQDRRDYRFRDVVSPQDQMIHDLMITIILNPDHRPTLV